MSTLFKIKYLWEKRSNPLQFNEEDYVDATVLFISLRRFLAIYQGYFVVQVNNLNLQFDLDPDLSTIFEDIPDVLEKLKVETISPLELYFFEQGTDVVFLLERKKKLITIRFLKGLSVGRRFEELPNVKFFVEADVFLREWVQFALIVLDALTTLQSSLLNDESYKSYRTRLSLISKDD